VKETYLDWHLVEWTRAQNRSNGVAPTASMLLKKGEALVRDSLQWDETRAAWTPRAVTAST